MKARARAVVSEMRPKSRGAAQHKLKGHATNGQIEMRAVRDGLRDVARRGSHADMEKTEGETRLAMDPLPPPKRSGGKRHRKMKSLCVIRRK